MLRVKDLIRFAKTQLDIHKFLPEYEYLKESNSEWFCNLINTFDSQQVYKFIDKKNKRE